jgi:hypothetical protein
MHAFHNDMNMYCRESSLLLTVAATCAAATCRAGVLAAATAASAAAAAVHACHLQRALALPQLDGARLGAQLPPVRNPAHQAVTLRLEPPVLLACVFPGRQSACCDHHSSYEHAPSRTPCAQRQTADR